MLTLDSSDNASRQQALRVRSLLEISVCAVFACPRAESKWLSKEETVKDMAEEYPQEEAMPILQRYFQPVCQFI